MDETRFHGLDLITSPGRVMTPRPATEALVDRALELVDGRPARVADVGTGSGAIAVALAARAPRAEIWATDTSAEAVWVARLNAARLGVDDRVHLLVGDLLEPVAGPLDLVLANLPYLPESEAEDPDIAGEPPSAVLAPGDGLGPYRRLLEQCESRLADDGVLVIQFRRRILEAGLGELTAFEQLLAA
ncbi:MAG TPA: HemK family protein methyltransferase [Gaiellaceae bacterium]|jgi:release factor glutamine methyltransferase|nr:HemK family protein methyltransferase [Gaiellaceae bacterium]